MSRRPPGHVALPRTCRNLLLAALLLPWQTVHAQQQQPATSKQAAVNVAATHLGTSHNYGQRKNTVTTRNAGRPDGLRPYEPVFVSDDASALNALALDSRSVRAPSLLGKGSALGLSSPPQPFARSLEEWEVEDFVLLATVNGDLYATDRKTGEIRWHITLDKPVVHTVHHRTNRSSLDEDVSAVDHYIWVVEPYRDGALYLWVPSDDGFALVPMPYTMKTMVEKAPLQDKEQDILYNGEKKTTLVTLDAAMGTVLKWFGPTGAQVTDSCSKPNGLSKDECSSSGTLTLGLTEYRVDVRHTNGEPIATLTYSEWGPNTFDDDLIQQHRTTKDNHYITVKHDGIIYGRDYSRLERERPSFSRKLNSPVARVFDVLRRWDSSGGTEDLTVLPQPPPPDCDEANRQVVFINQTEAGSWYALSGSRYPLVQEAPTAPIHSQHLWDAAEWETLNAAQISKALVGIHPLPTPGAEGLGSRKHTVLLLPPGPMEHRGVEENESIVPTAGLEDARILQRASQLPQMTSDKIRELISNPVAIVLAIMLVLIFQKDLRRYYKRKAEKLQSLVDPYIVVDPSSLKADIPSQVEKAVTTTGDAEAVETPDKRAVETAPGVSVEPEKATSPVAAWPVAASPNAPAETNETVDPPPDEAAGERKKKAHRGRRGGVKHRKGKVRREGSVSCDDDPPVTVEDVVNKAKNLGPQPRLEPDIQTVTNDVQEISGPILRMGSLEVDEDQQLGTGSNGTVVFAGKWDGRDVAVKRMLIQFNEIASQETKLLRESDDHPNVIRYFAQQQRAAFLYIALELCQASLADVVQKPYQHRELAQAGERDMPGVLYQVANGLCHLHHLRIVHRDLKPQNILVNMGKDGKPRLVVSDFGLCKKLEGANSSFGATTAHAAGTAGWRAPELLVDDDKPAASVPLEADPASSQASGSGSGLVGVPVGPNLRRVTRAIDIFSLGLVFFYVLTKGNHPFDCGDRYMREVNIRKGNFTLQPLDVLGDFAYEARDLISNMLHANPRERPSARDVMAHPFFWPAKKRLGFLCDVSDHFEKESRDPPSPALVRLEEQAVDVVRADFLHHLPHAFVESLGKQRKYTGGRLLDLLRALRNKRNHYEDMPESLKRTVGSLPEGYLGFWTRRFPNLLIACWNIVYEVGWEETDRFREYYQPAGL